MLYKPRQRIPNSQKNYEWAKEMTQYCISSAKRIVSDADATRYYNLAFGILEESQYLYVTNPRNTRRENLKGFPSKLRNIPIVPALFSVLMGEKTKRFIDYQVIAVNSNIDSKKKTLEMELVLNTMKNNLYNQLNPNEKNEELTPEEIKKRVNSLTDEMAVMGQEGLNYIRFYNDLDRKFKEMFFDLLCVNACASIKRIEGDEVIFDVIPPREISLIMGRGKTFIEEAECVVRRTMLSSSDIWDLFSEFDNFEKSGLKEALESDMQGQNPGGEGGIVRRNGLSEVDPGQNQAGSWAAGEMWKNLFGERTRFEGNDTYPVDHCVFDTYVKVGRLLKVNVDSGEIEKVEVDEDYIVSEGEEVTWTWCRQQYHTYQVNDKYVVGGEFLHSTRASYDNPNKNKKVYNGRILNGISTAALSMAYQVKHNVINYYLEKIIAKNRGDITIFPIGLLPDGNNDAGIDMDASMHYADADGFLFVDDSDGKKIQSLQYMKILSSTLNNSVSIYLEYLNHNRTELEMMFGVNAPRKGQTSASAGKFVSQQAEYRGSMMSEHLFTQADELHQKDLQGCLDLSQIAFSSGKRAMYINSNFKEAFLDVNPEVYSLAIYGVGVNNSSRATEKLNKMDMVIQAIAQDPNVPKTAIPKLIDADNMATLIKNLDEIMDDFNEQQQANQAALNDIEHRKMDEAAKITADKLEFDYYEVDSTNTTTKEVALIDSDTKLQVAGFNITLSEDVGLETTHKAMEIASKERLEMIKGNIAKEIQNEKSAVEKYKADKALQVAKENKPARPAK